MSTQFAEIPKIISGNQKCPKTGVSIEPLSANIGAIIHGANLREALTADQVKLIPQSLLRWKVVFFRDQHISHSEHIAFGKNFGELTLGHPVFGHVEDYPVLYSVAKHRGASRVQGEPLRRAWTGWHTDITAAINPPAASILRGVEILPYGGDTLWTNLAVAYQKLSAPMRAFVDTLRGTHRFTAAAGTTGTAEFNKIVEKKSLVSEHPLVTVHPETGEKILFVSPAFIKSINDVTPRESEVLLEYLWEHIVRTEFTVRFKWEAGSIAFWDNRSTAHLAPRDIFDLDFDRQLYRITLVGSVPKGVDGKESKLISGNPLLEAQANY